MPTVLICPGFHPPELTDRFLYGLRRQDVPFRSLVMPATVPPYAGDRILQFLEAQSLETRSETQRERVGAIAERQSPVFFFGFSAGAVGAERAARAWQQRGGSVGALVLVDGWGVPLWDRERGYRVSHDRFGHWSSEILGAGAGGFYADPPVAHLELWRSPHAVWGWKLPARKRMTAAAFFASLLRSRDG